MITLTIAIFSILGALVTGTAKLIATLFGVFFELLLLGIIISMIGACGFGILFLVDIIFLITKIGRKI